MKQLGIPRSTLQHWLKRRDSIDEDSEVVAFFESPVGISFLHRLTLAAHFVMTMLGPCGIRLVCLFLELTGLDRFVAASYGVQQKVSADMEEAIVTFDGEERSRLASGMPPKKIAICEDETFHPETCLVGIEPISNFILLEKYTTSRKAEQWSTSLKDAMAGLPVEVVQSTSDEGRGIRHHVEEDLGVHHSPDVFHVQHDLFKGTGVILANQKKRAENAADEARREVDQKEAEKEDYFSSKASRGRPPQFDKRIAEAQAQESEARKLFETAQYHQEKAKEAIRGIGKDYHPYDLETGAPRSAEEVSSALEQRFAEIEKIASEANLPERCTKKIKKAKRVMVNMVATIAFFFLTVRAKVEALSLAPDIERAVYNNLIPGIYLRLASAKAKSAVERKKLQNKSRELLAPLFGADTALNFLEEEDRSLLWLVAEECAQLFQRSSSCVEGRNGQLALRHHSLHRLRNRKLAALTTVHNYFVERRDCTTAAERLFGSKPRDLFQYLLERVDLPGRPAKKRSQQKTKEHLVLKNAA